MLTKPRQQAPPILEYFLFGIIITGFMFIAVLAHKYTINEYIKQQICDNRNGFVYEANGQFICLDKKVIAKLKNRNQ